MDLADAPVKLQAAYATARRESNTHMDESIRHGFSNFSSLETRFGCCLAPGGARGGSGASYSLSADQDDWCEGKQQAINSEPTQRDPISGSGCLTSDMGSLHRPQHDTAEPLQG